MFFLADGTRARLVHGPPVQGRDPAAATVAEEDQARGTAAATAAAAAAAGRAVGGLLLRSGHGAHAAQLHGGPVPRAVVLRAVGASAGGHVPPEQLPSSVQEREVSARSLKKTSRNLGGKI